MHTHAHKHARARKEVLTLLEVNRREGDYYRHYNEKEIRRLVL